MASPGSGLSVIALVSGGKDSFFSALHCLQNGHRLVAMANLHPPLLGQGSAAPVVRIAPVGDEAPASKGALGAGLAGLDLDPPSSAPVVDGARPRCGAQQQQQQQEQEQEQEETDLNSFMYQTVGHQVIPLYAEATGVPLYRRSIVGGAVQRGRDYAANRAGDGGGAGEEDETESMIPLLQAVIDQHPGANALSAGAILSTYQRTRVESVALRLGLTPLAYLWKYPVHPPPSLVGARDEAQLLFDMAAAGLEARIIKVASGGMDESFLWENAASAKGITRLKKATGRFGPAGMDSGAVLGEGGEFETLVVDGPGILFRKRIVVAEEDRVVVREGGGTAWLKVTRARVEEKMGTETELTIRKPDLWDQRFADVLDALRLDPEGIEKDTALLKKPGVHITIHPTTSNIQTWAVTCRKVATNPTIQEETSHLVADIRTLLARNNLTPASILSTVIVLRSMADFPAINPIYGSLFPDPNPPSRVTIACGDLLPPSSGNIAVYLTLHAAGDAQDIDRRGLHVQGRSYWAPANIGPYSQAISFLLPAAAGEEESSSSSSSSSTGRARVVHVAGQIPLVPASMELPSAGGVETQLALSLQHLWRVGAETGVRWWTSGAVYFPRAAAARSSPRLAAREKARIAWRAWEGAHRWSSSSPDGDEEGGPDLWDRKFNARYVSYAMADSGGVGAPALPDYSLLHNDDDEEGEGGREQVPFFFAAEVDELPRSAEAEWHAHAGLAGAAPGEGSVRVYRDRREAAALGGAYEVEHCVFTPAGGAGGCLHSVVAAEAGAGTTTSLREQVRETGRLFSEFARADGPSTPYLVYVDTEAFASEQINQTIREGVVVVPCASLWGGPGGFRLRLVALYRILLA